MVKIFIFTPMTRSLDNLQLDGGCIVFNFTNTVNSRTERQEFDYLNDYGDLLAWSEKAKVLDRHRLRQIKAYLEGEKKNGNSVFNNAIKTRELLYSYFSSIAKGDVPKAGLAESFNIVLGEAFSKIKIKIGVGKSDVVFMDHKVSLEEPIWTIIGSSFEILTQADHKRIGECPGCGWLFLDTSKNGKRRWCNMQVCGSQDKALRYYYKSKK